MSSAVTRMFSEKQFLQPPTMVAGRSADIERAGLIKPGWEKRLPYNASPYTSTVAFLVRKGNPKKIKDWKDLLRKDVQVIASNPKTSGGGRWAFLALWGAIAGAKTHDLSTKAGLDEADAAAHAALHRRGRTSWWR